MHGCINITGEFHCDVYENGELIKSFTEKNLVVDLAKERLATFLGTGLMDPIARIGVGSGTASPAASDTDLTNPTYTKELMGFTNPTTKSVKYQWEIGNSEANGITITEFGLLFQDSQLFARKTGLTVAKNGSISLSGYWTISFS